MIDERQFYIERRAALIKQAKQLLELRAAILEEVAAIERFCSLGKYNFPRTVQLGEGEADTLRYPSAGGFDLGMDGK